MNANGYKIRRAVAADIPFLADVIIEAEKGMSDRLSYSTLFNIPEEKVKDLIISMLEEQIDGCELSVSSFIVSEYDGKTVSGSGVWIEGFGGNLPSKILKSNLLSYTLGAESIEFLQTKTDIIKGVLVEREPMTLQLEYFHVLPEHQGKGLDTMLMSWIEEEALSIYPELEKVQCQMFKNSVFAMKILIKHGFKIVHKYKSERGEIFDYLPSDEKYLFEKMLKN
jgi:ribosomal protein S18 acetylase RimI-like enzyme